MAITVSNIPICSVPTTTDYFTQMPSGVNDSRNLFSLLSSNIYELSGNDSYVTIFENDILKIEGKANKSAGRPYMIDVRFYDKRTTTPTLVWFFNPTNLRGCYLALGYDDTSHLAYFLLAGQFYYSGDWNAVSSSYYGVLGGSTPSVRQQMYELISGSQINNWEQVVFKNTIFPSYQGTIVNFDCCEDTYVNRQSDEQNIAFINQYLTGNLYDSENFSTTETEIYRKGIYSITVERGDSGPGYEITWKFKVDNQQLKLAFSAGGNGSHRSKIKIALAINEAEQKGAFVLGQLSVNNYNGYVGKINSNLDTNNTAINLYNWLKENLPSPINWQSVPSVTGKGKTVNLSILNDVNDGEQVITDDTSKFDKSKENSLYTLISEQL